MSVDLRLVARRVANGDAAAFREIVTLTQARLFRHAARMLGDVAAAEDVLQDAYLNGYRALQAGNYNGKATVSTWLHRIVTNACIDALRRRRDRPEAVSPEPHYDGASRTDARLALREIESWLGALSPAQRAVVVLRLLEGISAEETAGILDCTTTAVEQRLLRARNALRHKRAVAEGNSHD